MIITDILNSTIKLTRRSLLKLGFTGSGLSILPVFSILKTKTANAQSAFTLEEESKLTTIICDIIPEDDDPGALQTGTPGYVIYYFSSLDNASIDNIKTALSVMDPITYNVSGLNFLSATTEQREVVYSILKSDQLLSIFWYKLRSITVFHFYAQPLGYDPIGLPGPSVDEELFFKADKRDLSLCSGIPTQPYQYKKC